MLRPALKPRQPENVLPKVLVCGTTEDNITKVVICDSREKKKRPGTPYTQLDFEESLTDVDVHGKLFSDHINMNNKRYQFQEEVHNKNRCCEYLQRKICGLQNEVRLLSKEYSELSLKFSKSPIYKCRPRPDSPCRDPYINPENCTQQTQTEASSPVDLGRSAEEIEEEMRIMLEKITDIECERDQLEQRRQSPPNPPRPPSPQSTYHQVCHPDFIAAVDFQLRVLHQQYQRLYYEIDCLKKNSEKFKCMCNCNGNYDEESKILKVKSNKIRKNTASNTGSKKSTRDNTESSKNSFQNSECGKNSINKTQSRNAANGTPCCRTTN